MKTEVLLSKTTSPFLSSINLQDDAGTKAAIPLESTLQGGDVRTFLSLDRLVGESLSS
jgi:hypothetical protein